jgi:hypothetical protein
MQEQKADSHAKERTPWLWLEDTGRIQRRHEHMLGVLQNPVSNKRQGDERRVESWSNSEKNRPTGKNIRQRMAFWVQQPLSRMLLPFVAISNPGQTPRGAVRSSSRGSFDSPSLRKPAPGVDTLSGSNPYPKTTFARRWMTTVGRATGPLFMRGLVLP